MDNLGVWLWLLLVMLPHNSRTMELLKKYGSAENAARAMRDGSCTSLSGQEKQRVQTTRIRQVRELVDDCNRLGIRIVTFDDPLYPSSLRSIKDPPIVLFVKGDPAALNAPLPIAVVGPRNISDYGGRLTRNITGRLSRAGAAVISGLAIGADAVAHRTALECGGVTVGVLGCGLAVNYPVENEALKAAILANGGALVSELLPHTGVASYYFRYRNRLIAGLALGTLVTEASSRSGTLLTAKHTMLQRKPVFVFPPHDIFDDRYSGMTSLIRKGAHVISDASDICRVLGMDIPEIKPTDNKRPEVIAEHRAPSKKISPEADAPEEKRVPSSTLPDTSKLSPEAAAIAAALVGKALSTDDIIAATGLKYDEVSSALLEMELEDVVIRDRDATYSLV